MIARDQILARVVKDESSTDLYGLYYLQPLERGYGITIGNALRRVLLTSIPGAAICSIKIDGVLHEFSTIPGVREDVTEIILNLKQVRIKLFDPKPDKITLQFKGAGEFKAGMIGENITQFEILNPDLHICTMNDKADFSIEIRITRGTGWVPAEKNKLPDFPIGTIFVDSIFSPIVNVTYKVDNLPGTAREILEKLTLEITTDGSITPDEALDLASNILRDFFGLFSRVEAKPLEYQREIPSEDVIKIRNLLKKSVDEMELSVRSYNCLKANNIRTIADLVSREESDMLKFKNFGRKSLNELMAKLKSMGLEFGMEVDKYLAENEE
ncbi:MAG: DNA-directed RNA polymerase subunit alpha [Candidatus Marinimicrobia bacterium]|nr:DNA-directed RNA polymerase subunit alpha [Candidatus Neomarinimicrobiota bacterium]MDD5230132.1 DNA-directed RNA polymerase subunit alpha [Candidatus Neomarinimicrobiota bacterium]MDD5539630.1 DNA-directed RNA polymerase subunit alpha [Candidatus Neomarinimicrobiota bacterium]